MEREEIQRRMHIARLKGGFETRADLATAIEHSGYGRGLGEYTIGEIERGDRTLKPHEVQLIADLCGVPPAFLTDESYDPFTAQPSTEPDRLSAVESKLDSLSDNVDKLAKAVSGYVRLQATPPRQAGSSRRPGSAK